MGTMEIILIIIGVVAFFVLVVSHLYMLRQIKRKYEARKEQIDREHQKEKERLERLHQKESRLPHNLLKRSVSMSYKEAPSCRQYSLLEEDLKALEQDSMALHQDWHKVGERLQEVLDAAPPPEECEGMTPDEFEETIRQNLKKRRDPS